jgi:hypothetical protein
LDSVSSGEALTGHPAFWVRVSRFLGVNITFVPIFGSILGVLAVEICHFLLETPPFLFQLSGCVLVVSQWKFCSLFPLRQRIVVAMESRRDELCFVGCSSY